MEPLSFSDFIVKASSHLINNTSERMGQAYMNSLAYHRPELHERVQDASQAGLDVNPFYDDRVLPAFLAFIASRWDQDQ